MNFEFVFCVNERGNKSSDIIKVLSNKSLESSCSCYLNNETNSIIRLKVRIKDLCFINQINYKQSTGLSVPQTYLKVFHLMDQRA
jgi:hypothetical protein